MHFSYNFRFQIKTSSVNLAKPLCHKNKKTFAKNKEKIPALLAEFRIRKSAP